MSATKHRTVRLSDEHWTQLAEAFRQVVSLDRRPVRANPESDWQITEGLRMIASGEIALSQLPAE